MVKLMKVL